MRVSITKKTWVFIIAHLTTQMIYPVNRLIKKNIKTQPISHSYGISLHTKCPCMFLKMVMFRGFDFLHQIRVMFFKLYDFVAKQNFWDNGIIYAHWCVVCSLIWKTRFVILEIYQLLVIFIWEITVNIQILKLNVSYYSILYKM